MIPASVPPTPGPIAVRPVIGPHEPPDPACDRCGRAAGRTYRVTPTRRYCWACLDRHLTNVPPEGLTGK